LPVGALVLDDSGVVVEANERAADLLGAALDALVGTPLTDHVHADHRDRLARLATGRPVADEPVVVRCLGEPPAWLRLDAAPDDDGARLVVLTDATEAVRTFRILRESAWTAAVVDQEGTRLWGPVGREHPEDRPSRLAGSAVDRVHPEDVAAVLDAFARVTAEPGRREQVGARLRDIDLGDTWMTGTVEVYNARHIPEVDGILVRVHERDDPAEVPSIARTPGTFLSVAEAAPVGIILTGPAGFPAYFNESVRSMLPGVGTGAAERDWTSWGHPDDREELRSWVDAVIGSGERVSRTTHFLADRSSLWLLVTIAPRSDEAGEVTGHVVTLQDVTAEVRVRHELEEAQQHLLHLASHDPLTGLANRAALAEALARLAPTASGDGAMARPGEPVGVLYCDLDGFKAVNDRHGHEAGDRVLVAVADRLREVCRATDLVVRLGGDEFLVLAAVDADRLDELAERIATAVAAPVDVGGASVRVGVSVGPATLRPGEGLDDLLHRADAAMYARKLAGRHA
jgi:diguanylate cyclase (GGDEF)-like protein/PAS domain S-box-containing protein